MPRLLLMLAPWLCLAACSIPESTMASPSRAEPGYLRNPTTVPSMGTEHDSFASQDPAAPAAAEARDRQVIHTAELSIEVAQTETAIRNTIALAEASGGYLSQRSNARLKLRIPAARFEEVLAAIEEMGRVVDQARQALDVTEQWLDLKVRIENARRARERLLALLERANAVEDILKIEKELTRLTTEIERMETQLQNLEQQVALSTIMVNFVAPAARPDRPRRERSRFDWINDVGADRAMRLF